MIYRFRHGIIEPLAIFWLIATIASVVSGAAAWSRFSRRVDALGKLRFEILPRPVFDSTMDQNR